MNPYRIAATIREPFTFTLTSEQVSQLDALEDGKRYCDTPWATFPDRGAGNDLDSQVLTGVACGLFSLVQVDVTEVDGDDSPGPIIPYISKFTSLNFRLQGAGWWQEWRERADDWYGALPALDRQFADQCITALGLSLASRLDQAYRLWRLGTAAAAPPPPLAAIGEQGCEKITSGEPGRSLNLPQFPNFPSKFELPPLIPIPRLLPAALEFEFSARSRAAQVAQIEPTQQRAAASVRLAWGAGVGAAVGMALGATLFAFLSKRKQPAGRPALRRSGGREAQRVAVERTQNGKSQLP